MLLAQVPYEIDKSGLQPEQEEGFISSLKRAFSDFLRSLKRFLLNLSMQSDEVENFKIALPFVISDNRLREGAPDITLSESEYIDIGKRSDGGIYRDVIIFEMGSFNQTDRIKEANLALFWYYPENQLRYKDTVLEV